MGVGGFQLLEGFSVMVIVCVKRVVEDKWNNKSGWAINYVLCRGKVIC